MTGFLSTAYWLNYIKAIQVARVKLSNLISKLKLINTNQKSIHLFPIMHLCALQYCLYYTDSLIDDRLKYNILSLTVLLGNMTASCEFWRWQLTVPVVTSYLTVQCQNTTDRSLKQTDCVFHSGGFHQWIEDVCAWESVFVINWDQLNCHEHQNAF